MVNANDQYQGDVTGKGHELLKSPLIVRLQAKLAAGDPGATAEFWRTVEGSGAPIIDMPDDDSEAKVTFLWRAGTDLQNVAVLGPLFGLDAKQNQLTHVVGSDVWYRTYRLPLDVRGRYWFSPNDRLSPLALDGWEEILSNWRRDPLNPEVFRDLWYLTTSDPREVFVSVLNMPRAAPDVWSTENRKVQAGTLTEYKISSGLLENERRIWVYVPAARGVETLGAVVFLDGHGYIHLMSAPTILDNLIAAEYVPPLIGIFVDTLGPVRETELPCYPPFANFLADELLPWVRERYGIDNDPTRMIVAGSSYGGLAATFAALRRPDAFGNVLSQSGSFWWGHDGDEEYEWLTRQVTKMPLLPLRFYLDVGRLETDPLPPAPSQLLSNRRLQAVLRGKGYDVTFTEFAGAHDEICWRMNLPHGLITLANEPI